MSNHQGEGTYVHPSAHVSETARIGPGTRIWQQAQVRDRAMVGASCILGKGVFVDLDVRIGDPAPELGIFVTDRSIFARIGVAFCRSRPVFRLACSLRWERSWERNPPPSRR